MWLCNDFMYFRFNNYKRSGSFYILTATTKLSLLTHLVRPVINNKDNLVGNEFYKTMKVLLPKSSWKKILFLIVKK